MVKDMMEIHTQGPWEHIYKKQNQTGEKALFMHQSNDRMAGSSPEWRTTQSAREQSVFALNQAARNPYENPQSTYAQSFQNYMIDSVPEEKAYGFGDMVDMINPLHHLPIIGTIYRNITGDDINPASKVIGGTLFGGGMGMASSIANVIAEEETGSDINSMIQQKISPQEGYQAYKQQHIHNTQSYAFDRSRPEYNE